MQINLDDILEGDSFSRHSHTPKTHNPKYYANILLTSESLADADSQQPSCYLQLDDNIFNIDSNEDFSEYDQSISVRVPSSHNSMRSKMPGQRLFYQSQAVKMRKEKEKEMKEEDEREEETKLFVPSINEKSKQLKSQYAPGDYNPQSVEKTYQKRELVRQKIKQVKEKEEIIGCTFRPVTNQNQNQKLVKNRSSPVFEHLYTASKTQQIKRELKGLWGKNEPQDPKPKGEVDKAFGNFLQRNQTFKQKQKQKIQMLDNRLHHYDAEGEKLFKPKISIKGVQRKVSTPRKQTASLKDLNQLLLSRVKKTKQIQTQLFDCLEEQEGEKETQYQS